MADLVRVRLNGIEKNVGASFAEHHGLEVLDEPARDGAGRLRAETRKNGRRIKPKTSVAKKAAANKAAVTEPAPDTKE